MPGLAELVPGRSRGMLLRRAYVFVAFICDAESKSLANSFRFVYLHTLSLFMVVRGDHLSMWECESERGHPERYKFFSENLLHPMRRFVLKFEINFYTFSSFRFHTTSIIFIVESQKASKMLKKFYVCNLSLYDGLKRIC